MALGLMLHLPFGDCPVSFELPSDYLEFVLRFHEGSPLDITFPLDSTVSCLPQNRLIVCKIRMLQHLRYCRSSLRVPLKQLPSSKMASGQTLVTIALRGVGGHCGKW
jgi:hypothetical protein